MTEEVPPQDTPFFIRVAGPGKHEIEEQLAEIVEEAIARYDGRDLGLRTRRDANHGHLRVDFTYDATNRPAAMEITRPVEQHIAALGSELLKLERRLREIAQAQELGSWMIAVRVGTDRRALEGPLVELMQSQRSRTEHALFSGDELPSDLSGNDRLRLARLLDLGLVFALRMNRGHDVLLFPPVSDSSAEGGFGDLLQEAMLDNAAKLREAGNRESHLVVAIDQLTVNADPAETPAPPLHGGIDVLWVFLGSYNAKWSHRLWRTTGDQRWDLLDHPLGEPASRS